MAEHSGLVIWTDAYLADTTHLSCLESGAYLHLLMAAWRSPNCTLPADDEKLMRMARCTPREWKKVRDTVMAFWTFDEKAKTWNQKRLLTERDKARDRSIKAKLAAEAKWQKNKKTANADAQAEHMQTHMPEPPPSTCSGDASPLTLKDNKTPPVAPPSKKTFAQAFDDEPDMKAACIKAAEASFKRHDHDPINFDLIFEEAFASFWLNEAANKKKADWPRTFVNWCLKDRDKPEFQIEPRAVTVGDAIMRRAWNEERRRDGSSWSRFRRECGEGKRGQKMQNAFKRAEDEREGPSLEIGGAGTREGEKGHDGNVHDEPELFQKAGTGA